MLLACPRVAPAPGTTGPALGRQVAHSWVAEALAGGGVIPVGWMIPAGITDDADAVVGGTCGRARG